MIKKKAKVGKCVIREKLGSSNGMREEEETKEGGEPSYAGSVFGNEESTSFFSLG